MSLRTKSLSPTAITTYLDCPLKYWFRYFTKEVDLGDTKAMRFGSAVHKALEALAKRLQTGEPLSAELCNEIAAKFPTFAAAQKISDPDLIKEGQDLVKARLYRHNPNYKVVATELSFLKYKVTTPKGVPLNGIIDLVQEISPESVVVVDYKTSRMAKTLQEAKKDIQLSMYDYMYSKIQPQYEKIWLALDFVRSEPVISERSIEERLSFELWLDGLWEALGDLKEKDVKPIINQFCPWCGFKHKCHAYQQVLNAQVPTTPLQSLSSEAEFTEEWKKVKALEKIAKQRIMELKSWADTQIDMGGNFQFTGDDSIISWAQSSRTIYDAATVLPYIPTEDLPKIVSIKNDALETYVNTERPDLKVLIGSAARQTPMAPRMTTRKK
jgi:hypothetical protein